MRSYALLILALAVLHARAASIPAPAVTEKKLPIKNDALDNVSLDNNDSEQELIDQSNTVKDVENKLRNSVPVENVPVKIIEEKPVIKTIALKEDSNDYIPDNDDSINIKRVEIDLKNPGPPQRQEHDSQNPAYYVDKERAVATIKQSIEESENIFKHGIQDVTLNFQNFFANNEELTTVQRNIINLRQNVNAEVARLSAKINSILKPEAIEVIEGGENQEKVSVIDEVKNRLKTVENKFNSGVDMLSEGVEILTILKEEDDKADKISGKADASTPTGSLPANPAPTSTTVSPLSNPATGWLQAFQTSVTNAFDNLNYSFQNFISGNQNQNPPNNQSGSTDQTAFNPVNMFQNLNFPNFFQGQNQNQNPASSQNQQPQGTAPAGTHSDETQSTERPNLIQQFQNSLQNGLQSIFPGQNNQQQQNQNPIVQAFQSNPVVQQISSIFQRPGGTPAPNQQTNQVNNEVISKPATGSAAVVPSNSVPADQTPQANPSKPPKESQPAETAPIESGPIQQLVQNNPVVQGITHTVQRIQGLSNPSKPKDAPGEQNTDSKGHKPGGDGGAANGDITASGLNIKSAPVKDEPEVIPEIQNVVKPQTVDEATKTE